VENIFYEFEKMNFLNRQEKRKFRRQAPEKGLGFKSVGIFIERVKRAAEFVQVFVAKIIVKNKSGADEKDHQEGDKKPGRRFRFKCVCAHR
jgi:hypothetical protein